jgi:hypothetical protein
MKFVIKKRDFSDNPVILDLDFKVDRFSHDVMGGPVIATVIARGARDQLFELVNHMRDPVEILTDKGERVWWGFLAVLDISWEKIQYGIDIDVMSNKVAVAYTNENVRFTTEWSDNDDSVSEYGEKEKLLSRSDATEADALQQRDTYLEGSKYPIPILKFSSGSGGEAKITCRGWFSSLEWQYYQNLTGFEGYVVTGQGGREVGEDDRPILAMSFQIGATEAWVAETLWLHIWRQGPNVPADNLNISICANNAGVPGTVLATSSIVGSEVPTKAEWIEFPLSTGVTLNTGTTYFIYAARSSAPSIDPNAYYMLDTNLNKGYDRGSLIYYNTNISAWQDASHKGDLLFKLMGGMETTDQISTIVSISGQFFQGTMIEKESSIESVQYRNGDSTGLYELLKLLSIGTSSSRRLLAEATYNRYLRIYEETIKPSIVQNSYGLDSKGIIYFPNGAHIDLETCPVGIWCHLVDVIPATVDLSIVADPSLFFIEQAEYDAGAGQYNIIKTRNQSSSFDIGGVDQG